MWTIEEIRALIVRHWRRPSVDNPRPNRIPDDPLLPRRMTAMGVDAEAFGRIEPALFGSLQTICGECEHPNLCRHDLDHEPANNTWEDYCPNAVVLHAVKELRWFRRSDARN